MRHNLSNLINKLNLGCLKREYIKVIKALQHLKQLNMLGTYHPIIPLKRTLLIFRNNLWEIETFRQGEFYSVVELRIKSIR